LIFGLLFTQTMTMKALILIFITALAVSCGNPIELIKSSDLAPKCHCEGSGESTIVMEAGMGNWSLFYQPLFDKLKKDNMVCLIDRAGYDMDSITTESRNLETVAKELDSALNRAGIGNNIILVGHSLGGLYVRQYQALYPERVAGLVLLDASSSNQFDRLPREFYEILKAQPQQLEEVISIAQKGYLKYTKGKIPTFGLPTELLEQYYSVVTQAEYYCTMKMEVEAFEENLKAARELTDLQDLPLLIIGSKNSIDQGILPTASERYPYQKHNETWLNLQEELTNLSSNSTFVVSNRNHYLNLTDADLVYSSIIDWTTKNFRNEG